MNVDKVQVATYLSIAVIAVSLFFIGIELTGYALTDTGLVNVTIETSASILFSTALLDLGNGTVTPSQVAQIDSSGGNNAYWSGDQATGNLTLENNGNINVSFTLKSNKTADAFLGGDSPTFLLLVSDNEEGSCVSTTNFTAYGAVTTDEQLACTNFGYEDAADTVAIDARVTVSDSAAGSRSVGIIATATSI